MTDTEYSGLDRRTFGKILGTGLVAAAAGAPPNLALAQEAPAKFDPLTFTGPGLEAETGGAIYHLPRDHAMHGGLWYRGALLHKSADGRTAPIPGQTYSATFVTGMPSAV